MDKVIPIQKNIYSSNKFKEVIDTDFSELFNTQDNFSVDDFFNQYNRLFIEIPLNGQSSHAELIRRSSELLGPTGPDAKDREIENLQAALKDLSEQLVTANQPDISTTREHPRFSNGSIIGRPENSLVGWPDAFVMDQGFKRPIFFSGDQEFYGSFLKISGYSSNNPVPKIPDFIIDDIPTGEPLTEQNFNDEFNPPKGSFEAEEFRITIDPSDASLNFNNYDGNVEEYRSALENDYSEKTNLIVALEEKINGFNTEIQKIRG
jgi:hypothetical protein